MSLEKIVAETQYVCPKDTPFAGQPCKQEEGCRGNCQRVQEFRHLSWKFAFDRGLEEAARETSGRRDKGRKG